MIALQCLCIVPAFLTLVGLVFYVWAWLYEAPRASVAHEEPAPYGAVDGEGYTWGLIQLELDLAHHTRTTRTMAHIVPIRRTMSPQRAYMATVEGPHLHHATGPPMSANLAPRGWMSVDPRGGKCPQMGETPPYRG